MVLPKESRLTTSDVRAIWLAMGPRIEQLKTLKTLARSIYSEAAYAEELDYLTGSLGDKLSEIHLEALRRERPDLYESVKESEVLR